ncbi:MAG: hypothetical protein KCHDKBKB_02071 [Elusimicrobia bacterium]|nr:hypothetical protein [Elusimicrobiota bacterium]
MRKMKMLLLLLGLVPLVQAQAEVEEVWKKEMERKIEILTQEIERGKMGAVAQEPVYEKAYGLAPAASKVYHVNHGVSLGGYGEMVLQDWSSQKDDGTASNKKSELDFLRAILYVGHKFSDKILFNSEIEFEHATTGGGSSARGEVSLEFAYLDFMPKESFGFRAGLVLVPVGIINEIHEPTTFHGARRPNVEQELLPSTWRENGVGVFGKVGSFSYRSYVMSGLQASSSTLTGSSSDLAGVNGFSASTGIRNGRSKGSKSIVEDWAWVGRVDYEGIPGTVLGGSYYTGDAGQDIKTAQGQEVDVPVDLWEIHGMSGFGGLELRGLYSQIRVGDVAELNVIKGLGTSGTNSVGERMFGGYLEAAYDILPLMGSKQYLAPFVRWERIDTQERVPSGYTKNPANSRTEMTFGITYKPHPRTVVKVDFQDIDNQAGTGIDKFNAAVGYHF